jgi:hypothetical protein
VQLRKAFFLPSTATVRDYKQGLKTDGPGVHILFENLKRWRDELQSGSDWDRSVCLCFDAMKMREHLVCNVSTHEIIGLDDGFGENSAVLLEFMQRLSAPMECGEDEVRPWVKYSVLILERD